MGTAIWTPPNFMSARDHLFSYGVFAKDQPMHKWLHAHCEPHLIGPGTLEKALLLDLGGFPGLKHGEGTVHGEVWSIPWATTLDLRALASKNKIYDFRIENIEVKVGGQMLSAKAFFFYRFLDGKARGVRVIKDGVWKSQ